MALSQDTQPSEMNKRETTLAFILRILFFFLDSIMARVASKQQTANSKQQPSFYPP